ncbi:collagen-binding domain-containing protein [Dellaglioa sp. BT-FLS60]
MTNKVKFYDGKNHIRRKLLTRTTFLTVGLFTFLTGIHSIGAISASTMNGTAEIKTELVEKSSDSSIKATDAATSIQASGSVYDDVANINTPLKLASAFHIFTREAILDTHTSGNIAVETLVGNTDFGSKIVDQSLVKDISYIKNVKNILGSSFVTKTDTRSNKAVFGIDNDLDITEPNRPKVNGTYLDHLTLDQIFQDKPGLSPYIDFDKEFDALKATNRTLASLTPHKSYQNSDFADRNSREIDISTLTPNPQHQIIINLEPDVLAMDTPLTISGLSKNANDRATIIFNVNASHGTMYNINSQIKLKYLDGSFRHNQETEFFGDNHLLWNFYERSLDLPSKEGLKIAAPFQGSILAPYAPIEVIQNLDGNIIGKSVHIRAESHRWDLQESTSTYKEPDPVVPDPIVPDPVIPDPVTPDPVVPDPIVPDPVTPDPVVPDPIVPDPVTPDPVVPDPIIPDPVVPDPVTPDPVTPDPVTPDPVVPDPIDPDPVTPDPVVPDPVVPDPVTPDPIVPDPVVPDPIIPNPVTPDPIVPDPVIPDPVTPDPVTPIVFVKPVTITPARPYMTIAPKVTNTNVTPNISNNVKNETVNKKNNVTTSKATLPQTNEQNTSRARKMGLLIIGIAFVGIAIQTIRRRFIK